MVSLRTVSFSPLVALFVAVVSAGIAILVNEGRSGSPGVEILLPTASPTPELKVYITGAVARPGVYTVQEGERLADTIIEAGGTTQDAQLPCVNLAVRVQDEGHYHIHGAGEPCQTTPTIATGGADARLDVNTATGAELETLPNIGPARAQAIIDYREREGPFRSLEDLIDVPGIGPAIYDSIKELVRVGEDLS